jgi:hypothetical protein
MSQLVRPGREAKLTDESLIWSRCIRLGDFRFNPTDHRRLSHPD